MQHHGCSISRPRLYDNHRRCMPVSTELSDNAPNGDVASLSFWGPHSSVLPNKKKLLEAECFENFNLVSNMHYFAALCFTATILKYRWAPTQKPK